jgi:hypothetical protein
MDERGEGTQFDDWDDELNRSFTDLLAECISQGLDVATETRKNIRNGTRTPKQEYYSWVYNNTAGKEDAEVKRRVLECGKAHGLRP